MTYVMRCSTLLPFFVGPVALLGCDRLTDLASGDDPAASPVEASASKAKPAPKTKPAEEAVVDETPKPPAPAVFKDVPWKSVVRVSDQQGVSVIDTTNIVGGDKTLTALAIQCDSCDGVARVLDPKTPLFPAAHAIGDSWVVVGEGGVVIKKVRAFGATVGTWEPAFLIALDDAGASPISGIAFPADVAPNPKAKLVAAKALPESSPVSTKLLGIVWTAAGKILPPSAEYQAWDKDGEVFALRASTGERHLVELEAFDDDGVPDFSALALVVPGESIHWVHKPNFAGGRISVAFLVDLDGDGVDEVLWYSSDHDGFYRYIMAWDGDTPRQTKIGSDNW